MSSDLAWVVTFYVVCGYLGLLFALAGLGVLLAVLVILLVQKHVSGRSTSRIH